MSENNIQENYQENDQENISESENQEKSESDEKDSEIQNIGQALEDVPFEELLKMKSQGFTKKKKAPKGKDFSLKKGKKGEPVERSAKIPVKLFEPIKSEKKKVFLVKFLIGDRFIGTLDLIG